MRTQTLLAACAWVLMSWNASALARETRLPVLESGPFRIETQVRRISTGDFPNLTANPFGTREVTGFTVLHRGRRVVVPLANGDRMERFWDARVLEGSPKPALIAGQTQLFLLSDRDGELHITALLEPSTNIATIQWLDADNGQPGAEDSVLIHDARGRSPILTGGRRLLIGGATVLDVATLEAYRFRQHDSRARLGGYHASGEPARALSPDGRQLVMVGSRYDGDYRYALIAIDYTGNTAYAVPFQRTATRFHSVWDATPAWFAHYFEWQPDAELGYRLAIRGDVEALPWQGRLVEFAGGMVEYRLQPVDAGLLDRLADFITADGSAIRMPTDADGRAVLHSSEGLLSLWYHPEDSELSLYASPGPGASALYARIRDVGESFNRELGQGHLQEHFGSLD